MSWAYDESLAQNPFFLYIQKHHGDIIKRASEDNWIICIPRLGTLDYNTITSNDVLEHTLIPTSEPSCSCFRSLNRQHELTIEDKCIICASKKHIRILFEETFYVDKCTKYVMLCIERPLSRKTSTPEYFCFLNLQDCVQILQEKYSHIIEYIHKYVQNVESQLDTNDLNALKTTTALWYKDIIKVCDSNIKLAVETYIQHYMYNKLFASICNCTAENDAGFNKIIRNSADVQLKDLDLNEYIEGMPLAKYEFSSINNFSTILDKVSCLRKALKALSSKTTTLLMTADITLKLFVFLIIKSNINNWIANLIYITQFKYVIDIFDEHSYFVTTLEAAVEFIKNGKLFLNNDLSSTQLFHFIKAGNLDMVKKYIESDSIDANRCHPLCACNKCGPYTQFNINSCDDKGLTALHVACFYGHPHIVDFLISRNVNIDIFDYSEMTPIHYSALKGHQNAILILLHAGACIVPKNGGGNTPLHLASNNGHENCVKALAYFAEQQGSSLDINCTNNFGDTPLHLASKWGFCGIVNILMQYGADKSVKNKRLQTPVDNAQCSILKNLLMGNKIDDTNEIVQFSPKNYKIRDCKSKQVDLLFKSIENCDTPLMCYYLGIPTLHISLNSDIANNFKCHPLCNCESCVSRQTTTSEKSKNVNPLNINISNVDGFTALHVAASYDNTELVRILLDSGANINVKTKNMSTPLHLACINQCTNAVRELLKCGNCNVDAQDFQGNTPIHYAAVNNNSRIAEILLSNSSNYDIKNCTGKTAMQVAKDKAHFNILKLFSNKNEYDKDNNCDLFN